MSGFVQHTQRAGKNSYHHLKIWVKGGLTPMRAEQPKKNQVSVQH